MLRQVTVQLYDKKIGILRQDETGFYFNYLPDYQGVPLSLSFLLSQQEFHSPTLFPYFVSLVPEGWLKQKYSQLQKIDEWDLPL